MYKNKQSKNKNNSNSLKQEDLRERKTSNPELMEPKKHRQMETEKRQGIFYSRYQDTSHAYFKEPASL